MLDLRIIISPEDIINRDFMSFDIHGYFIHFLILKKLDTKIYRSDIYP